MNKTQEALKNAQSHLDKLSRVLADTVLKLVREETENELLRSENRKLKRIIRRLKK